ncbi:MAG: hypothetical protein N3D84_04030 [Candidatus Woesearchaeota archaeon]|nr:hypothetical protein [Candidatus Woesearchaeota archaeon]
MEEKSEEKDAKEVKEDIKQEKQDTPTQLSMEEKQKFLRMSEISVILDSYDDIFTDFDPRPYIHRGLSDDFLKEIKNASREKSTGEIELKLLIPKDKRKSSDEILIRKRLREHFRKHLAMVDNERKDIIKKGFAFVISGIIFMFFATYLQFKDIGTFFSSFFIILLEPAGWFSFWEGLNLIIFKSKEKKPDLDFYTKMKNAEVIFVPY